MKRLLLITVVAFMFSACNRCKECKHEDYEYYTIDNSQFPYDEDDRGDYGAIIQEVCSDNFETKKDFNDFIKMLEDEDYECKSDFWN